MAEWYVKLGRPLGVLRRQKGLDAVPSYLSGLLTRHEDWDPCANDGHPPSLIVSDEDARSWLEAAGHPEGVHAVVWRW